MMMCPSKSNGTTVDETLKKQKTETGALVTANGGGNINPFASNTIFVGGLSFDAEESDVKAPSRPCASPCTWALDAERRKNSETHVLFV